VLPGARYATWARRVSRWRWPTGGDRPGKEPARLVGGVYAANTPGRDYRSDTLGASLVLDFFVFFLFFFFSAVDG
jgi:hypothetical protein